MGLSPHQVLSRLADHQRSEIQESLADMGRQRQRLQVECEEIKRYRQQLMYERDQALQASTTASVLMMMGAAMQEQHVHLQRLQENLAQLKVSEKNLMKSWVEANQKYEVHETMQAKEDRVELRVQERRFQQQMDDTFAARYSREEDGS